MRDDNRSHEAEAAATSTASRPWFATATVATGVLASILLVEHNPGVNVPIVGILAAVCVLLVLRDRLRPVDWVFGCAGIVFLGMFALRNCEWLLAANFVAAAGLGSLAASGAHTWGGVVRSGFTVLRRLPRGLLLAIAPFSRVAADVDRAAARPVLRGSGIGVLLVVIFGTLFVSSDRAFGQIASDLLVPDWELGPIPARVTVALVTIALIGAYALTGVERDATTSRSPWRRVAPAERRPVAILEWAIPMALLDLLFAAFVLVQIAVLFGGREHVLTTSGLTYAEYARSGFFELVAVAALVLCVIAVTVRWGSPASPGARRLMQVLVGTLCVLTLVVLVSALRRLGLYEETYGFTRLRFFVHLTIFWMSALFLSLMVAGAVWRGGWLPRTMVAVTAVFLLGANAADPDAFIAQRNVERYRRTGKIDVTYISSLSHDAVPALARLPGKLRTCVLTSYLHRLPGDESAISYNVGRSEAAAVLEDLPEASQARALVCRESEGPL